MLELTSLLVHITCMYIR